MGTLTVNGGTGLGSNLQELLDADDLRPGDPPSYNICKQIYAYHPLGQKLAEAPIALAMSQERKFSVKAAGTAEEKLIAAFKAKWKELDADKVIFTHKTTARIYGIASVALMVEGIAPETTAPYRELYKKRVVFNIWDPLNTAGSLTLNQDPQAFDFQKVVSVSVQGKTYHRSRTLVAMHESPLYIEWTSSSFGYVGRSVYQRALYPLKSFLGTMVTDDMVSRKAGLLVAMIKQVGSIADAIMAKLTGIKRALLKEAETDQVISISPDEKIESLNLQNLDGAGGFARTNILKNIATAADMPAVILENETLTEGFGEGTEDAKTIANYADRMRKEMNGEYLWFDEIVLYMAWTPDLYETIQAENEEYTGVTFDEAFYRWKAAFTYEWPSLLTEPESEQIKVAETKYRSILGLIETLSPMLDPENKAKIIEWAQQNFNENRLLFSVPLDLDTDTLATWLEERQQQQDEQAEALASGGAGGADEEGGQKPSGKVALKSIA